MEQILQPPFERFFLRPHTSVVREYQRLTIEREQRLVIRYAIVEQLRDMPLVIRPWRDNVGVERPMI
jgi:hypothetical protein